MKRDAFKSQNDILTEPFGWPSGGFSLRHLKNALKSPTFNVVAAYGTTLLIVGPASYAIARGTWRYQRIVMLVLPAGLLDEPVALGLIPA